MHKKTPKRVHGFSVKGHCRFSERCAYKHSNNHNEMNKAISDLLSKLNSEILSVGKNGWNKEQMPEMQIQIKSLNEELKKQGHKKVQESV